MNQNKLIRRSARIVKPIKTIQKTKVDSKRRTNPNPKSEPQDEPKPQSRSLPRSAIPESIFFDKASILAPDFYQIDALDLAPRLLGKFLRNDDVVLQITEFGPGGHAYVYLCYGLHNMLNVVADKEGVGSAVLIRSCAPAAGLETIKRRRGLDTDKPILLTGPGKVGQALGISTDWSHHPLFAPGGLELLDGPRPQKILMGPRVGIEYASPEHISALWRFAIADTPWISAPKNTLRLA